MPTFTGKTFASFYKNLLGIDQSSNTGVDATTRAIQDGLGNNTAVSLSDDVLQVKPVTDNTTGTMNVQNSGGSSILSVDTTNSLVKCGSSQVNATTQYKEMGLYEFSPNSAGYHYPLIANRVGMQGAEGLTYDDDWGNATDPPTTLDVSGLTDPENAIAIYWYIEDSITIDAIRYMCIADGSSALTFHLFGYTIDTSSNYGDLSSGVVLATGSSGSASGSIRTGTMSISSANVSSGKVIIGFVESNTTDDLSVHFNIKYHIQ